MQAPSEDFSVLKEESNGALHLNLAGWLDASAVPALLRSVTRGRPGDVVLDIEGLDHIDGSGWLGVISCEQRVATRRAEAGAFRNRGPTRGALHALQRRGDGLLQHECVRR